MNPPTARPSRRPRRSSAASDGSRGRGSNPITTIQSSSRRRFAFRAEGDDAHDSPYSVSAWLPTAKWRSTADHDARPAVRVALPELVLERPAERIGHGVRVLEDETIVALARERGTAFEVCVTSNYQSGVIGSLDTHPLMKMLEAGLNVTINTDDPSISRITLSHEYYTACEDLRMTQPTLRERIVAAANACFLPESQKEQLATKLYKDLKL